MSGNATGAAANIQQSLRVGRNVAQDEFAIVFLSAGKVCDRRLYSILPVPVVQILRADEVAAGKKTRDQANLLPGFPFFAPDGLRTNKKGHLGFSILV